MSAKPKLKIHTIYYTGTEHCRLAFPLEQGHLAHTFREAVHLQEGSRHGGIDAEFDDSAADVQVPGFVQERQDQAGVENQGNFTTQQSIISLEM
jgi:hypothetical protein